MSDNTKLRPEDLTAEERALWDQIAVGAWLGHPAMMDGVNFADSFDAADRFIFARRALFGTATEKAVCPNCKEETGENHVSSYNRDSFTCQPATEKVHGSAFPVGNCPACGDLVAPYNKHAKYEGGYTCQPAQPEPADSRQDRADQIKSFLGGDDDEPAQLEPAAQGEISELDDRHNRMASPEYQAKVKADMGRKVVEIGMDRLVGVTAAQEMPEAVKNAIVRMRWIADHNCGPYYQEWGKPVREAAEKLESWWRTHSQSAAAEKARQEGFDDGYLAGRTYELTFAQPVALRMTPELSRVLHAANEYADDLADCNASGYSELLSDIGAVIQQAAQPAAVGMTEELALVLDAADEVHRESTYLGRHEKAFSLGAAISNLRQQAALGKPKVELPKVREFIDFILAYREKYQLQVPFSSLEMTMFKLADTALSELDAFEGRS